MANASNVFIYTGQGVNPFCAEATRQSISQLIPNADRRVIMVDDPSKLGSRECLSQRNVLVIPGGNALQMMNDYTFISLGEKIREALAANTVSYLGICAGTYITPWWKCLSPSMCNTPRDENLYEVLAVPISLANGELFHVARWGGGYYEEIAPSETPVAYYQSSKDIAILRSRANVVLSCVHPELQLHIPYIREHLPIEDAEAKKLLPDSRRQQKLLADLLKLLDVDAIVPQENPDCDDNKPTEKASPAANSPELSEEVEETNSFWSRRSITYIRPSDYSPLHLLIKNSATDALREQIAQWLEFMHPKEDLDFRMLLM